MAEDVAVELADGVGTGLPELVGEAVGLALPPPPPGVAVGVADPPPPPGVAVGVGVPPPGVGITPPGVWVAVAVVDGYGPTVAP